MMILCVSVTCWFSWEWAQNAYGTKGLTYDPVIEGLLFFVRRGCIRNPFNQLADPTFFIKPAGGCKNLIGLQEEIFRAGDALAQHAGRIEVGTGHDAARGVVWLHVQDNGPGIPAHVLPSIFHPFFTTKGVGVGTGLGLYISYEIVKKHGGEITVETGEGQGALFKVELPAL